MFDPLAPLASGNVTAAAAAAARFVVYVGPSDSELLELD